MKLLTSTDLAFREASLSSSVILFSETSTALFLKAVAKNPARFLKARSPGPRVCGTSMGTSTAAARLVQKSFFSSVVAPLRALDKTYGRLSWPPTTSRSDRSRRRFFWLPPSHLPLTSLPHCWLPFMLRITSSKPFLFIRLFTPILIVISSQLFCNLRKGPRLGNLGVKFIDDLFSV